MTHATVDAVAVGVVAAAVMTNVTEMMTVVRHAWQLVVTESDKIIDETTYDQLCRYYTEMPCYVGVKLKSVSKSIFKRRHNVLPVVVFKMSNIRRLKLNSKYIISATQLTAQLTAQLV